MKKILRALQQVRDARWLSQSVDIAAVLTKRDPYWHDWCRQANHTLVCSKCGVVHLCKVSDGRVYNRCSVHTDHPNN